MILRITGKIIEVGVINEEGQMAVVIHNSAGSLTVTGLTAEQTRDCAKNLYEHVSLTIEQR